MSSITPDEIKRLRARTGVSIGKCKEALKEAEGDMEKAIEILRKMGVASAVKKEGRETKEGVIVNAENDDFIVMVEVNAETDFVVGSNQFKEFAQHVVATAVETRASSLEQLLGQKLISDRSLTVDEYRAVVVQSLGENIKISRLQLIQKFPDASFGVYSHMGGKIVAVVELKGLSNQVTLAHSIAMHTAAEAPDYLDPDKVPEAVKEQEKEIARSQVVGKPPQIVEKIIEGKMKAFYEQTCLLCQKFIKDTTVSVATLLEEEGKRLGSPLGIGFFVRWKVGE